MKNKLLLSVLGIGGHGKVVVDAAYNSFPLREIVIYDKNSDLIGKSFLNNWIIRDASHLEKVFGLHVAVGNNVLREELSRKHVYDCTDLYSIIHPNAIVSSSSTISEGSFIAAGAIIAPHVILGHGVIVNHMAIVDHESIIGDWAHIAPNVTLGGQVTVGKGVLVGAGAVVLPNIHIGDYAVIGAGAVVTKDVPAKKIVVGVPARSIG